MIDIAIVILFVIAAAGTGYESADLIAPQVLETVTNIEALRWTLATFSALLGLAIGLNVQVTYRRLVQQIRKTPIETILTRAIGLAIGLLLANLLLAPIFLLPIPEKLGFIKPLTAILGSIMFSFLGISLADTHGRTFLSLVNPASMQSLLVAEGTLQPAAAKVLDTSSIIDGRIEQLLDTGFIEGQLLVPQFVLKELQRLADAANDRKRARGRRGLDILKRIQAAYPDRISLHKADYDDPPEVDAKLVRFSQEIGGVLVTTDYNLNKVADLQGIQVLNVNQLAQSMRPIYLPGDTLELKILKQGKEPAQGVGYLEDGTMVVVEEGVEHVGDELPVVVTSALQTSAGRMIFARLSPTLASS